MFNIEVHGEHVFYVSEANILVHNSYAAGRVNLNRNDAVAHFGLYEIRVNGALYKIGKADLGRITKSSGNPTRLHQQLRQLRKVFAKGNVDGIVVADLGRTTTLAAKQAEFARIKVFFDKVGIVPVGNRLSFKP